MLRICLYNCGLSWLELNGSAIFHEIMSPDSLLLALVYCSWDTHVAVVVCSKFVG
jgi:hypothetical protein